MQVKTATVYWLHLKEYTDVTSQGYIGVTSRSSNLRFNEHCNKFKNAYSYYNPLHLAFANYGLENIIKTDLYNFDLEQCYELECILRPFDYIGWNSVQGGKLSPTALEIIKRKRNAIFIKR